MECKQAILKWDHPHAYGDKEVSDIADEMSDGSSPRVWGQELICPHCKSSDRIIPTRMGTSRTSLLRLSKSRDHPHAYGDKKSKSAIRQYYTGSSPRVWGQGIFRPYQAYRQRIIPTRMGTSSAILFIRADKKDHPHAYGDKASSSADGFRVPGSSPRVWGQAFRGRIYSMYNRIIPTRMGTSYTTGFSICQGGDHPHAYGDK